MTLLNELIEIRRKLPPVDRNSIRSTLAERFLLPPFSVLDARQGYWQKRKRAWLSLGNNNKLDHGSNLLDMSASAAGITDPKEVAEWNARRRKKKDNGLLGISPQARSHYNETTNSKSQGGTSCFDPVLCEAMYRWFCPKGGKVLDPFAGGDMQGIVAGCIGRSYHGVDLREKQVNANRKRKEEICPDADVKWEIGDAIHVDQLYPNRYDFILSNPPYADLEVYSDDPRDLSTMDYKDFLEKYRNIVRSCCSLLLDNRFAMFLVGEVRDKETGNYYNFVGDTIQAFLDCGMKFYNEAILVTSVGSLPIRVATMFKGSRKLGKTHQNVLIFLKGDAEQACLECGEVEIDNVEMPDHCPRPYLLFQTICIENEPNKASVINEPTIITCLKCDIARCEAIKNGKPIPRMWLATQDGWKRLEDLVELTYVVGGVVYLNREVFPEAPIPPVERPPVRTLRR